MNDNKIRLLNINNGVEMNQPEKAIIIFSCPDTRGIVSEVAFFVSTYNGNIIHAAQHKDQESNTFFMRIEWDLDGFTIPREKIEQAFEPLVLKYKMNCSLHFSDIKLKAAIFVSKFDHCLYEILIRNQSGELECDIKAIISNHENCRPIADYFKIPYYYIPVSKSVKNDAEAQQDKVLKENNIDMIILARYMQILSPQFVQRYTSKIINIHHSFLPAFVGAKPYHQAFKRGVKIIGATSHYVTQELDQGPIIGQDVTRISHRDSVPDLIRKGRDLEKRVLSNAIKLHLEHRVLVFGNKTVLFDYY